MGSMQVTETNADGLKREIKVVLGANELSERCEKRLAGPAVPDHNRGEALGGSAVVRAGTAATPVDVVDSTGL